MNIQEQCNAFINMIVSMRKDSIKNDKNIKPDSRHWLVFEGEKINAKLIYFKEFYINASRYTDNQIMAILKQAEASTPAPELCCKYGMSSATFN